MGARSWTILVGALVALLGIATGAVAYLLHARNAATAERKAILLAEQASFRRQFAGHWDDEITCRRIDEDLRNAQIWLFAGTTTYGESHAEVNERRERCAQLTQLDEQRKRLREIKGRLMDRLDMNCKLWAAMDLDGAKNAYRTCDSRLSSLLGTSTRVEGPHHPNICARVEEGPNTGGRCQA